MAEELIRNRFIGKVRMNIAKLLQINLLTTRERHLGIHENALGWFRLAIGRRVDDSEAGVIKDLPVLANDAPKSTEIRCLIIVKVDDVDTMTFACETNYVS